LAQGWVREPFQSSNRNSSLRTNPKLIPNNKCEVPDSVSDGLENRSDTSNTHLDIIFAVREDLERTHAGAHLLCYDFWRYHPYGNVHWPSHWQPHPEPVGPNSSLPSVDNLACISKTASYYPIQQKVILSPPGAPGDPRKYRGDRNLKILFLNRRAG